MVAGMERYYQIARCYRDEDFRADRQPEFTQLDIEMSFVTEDDVLTELGEAIVKEIWALIGVDLPTPFPRMSYAEAMRRFGSDKPDLRFGNARRVHRLLQGHALPGSRPTTSAPSSCPAARASRASSSTPGRSGPSSVVHGAWPMFCVQDDGGWAVPWPRTCPTTRRPVWPLTSVPSPVTVSSSPLARRSPRAHCSSVPPASRSVVVATSSTRVGVELPLGQRRPLFEPASEAVAAGDVAVGGGAWTAVHHAFTSPKAEFGATFDTDPGPALAYAYDMVCNGNEIGGGSIRIHKREVQERVFAVMGLTDEEAQEKFGFLLDAFAFRRPARRHRLRVGPDRHAARRFRQHP